MRNAGFGDKSAAAICLGAPGLLAPPNYGIGDDPAQWRAGIPTFAKVRYRDICPGVDLRDHGKTWSWINGPDKIERLLRGVALNDGEPVQDHSPAQQQLAA
jgi:hypothetical protein